MEMCLKHSGSARAATFYFFMLVVFTPAEAGEFNQETEPHGEAAMETRPAKGPSEEKHEDVLDRVFSPLDNAVSDINRDLNKEEDRAAPQQE